MILVLLMIDSPFALANKTGETGEALAGKEALPVEAAAPASADAESGEPEIHHCGDYDYVILEDGTAEITGYSGYDENLTIPSQLDDIPVISIGDYAFQGCVALQLIVGRNTYAEEYCKAKNLDYFYSN